VQLAASNLNLLQSLTGTDGVNGDRVLVQRDNNGEHDGDRDASQDKVPAGSGAPRNVTNLNSCIGGGGTGLRVNKLEARTGGAVGNVISKGLSDTSPSQEGDNNRDHNQNARHNDEVTQEGSTDGEDEFVAEAGKEVQSKNNSQQSRHNQGDESEGLRQLDNAEASGSVNIEVEDISLNLLVADSLGGNSLKRILVGDGAQNSLGVGLSNDGRRCNQVGDISGLVPSDAGSCNGDSENGQSQKQRDNVESLERKASHSRCSARRNISVPGGCLYFVRRCTAQSPMHAR
jgi:hypothetical protein